MAHEKDDKVRQESSDKAKNVYTDVAKVRKQQERRSNISKGVKRTNEERRRHDQQKKEGGK